MALRARSTKCPDSEQGAVRRTRTGEEESCDHDKQDRLVRILKVVKGATDVEAAAAAAGVLLFVCLATAASFHCSTPPA